MSALRDQIDGYVKRVKDLADVVRGNEQATKASLLVPFFSMLGYDLTDPRECIPEYKADFGKDRSSTKPIDWAFLHSGQFAFFVEAKEITRKLAGYDEQLADYFAKDPNVKLGILTNAAQWRFFTDVENDHLMDKTPFATWDVLSDQSPPYDVLTLLQKSAFNPELIRAYARRQRDQNLLVNELTVLLEPSDDFTRLAVANLETRKLVQSVVDTWKPIVANALNEWARQRMLTAALEPPAAVPTQKRTVAKIETTQDELKAFDTIKTMLGSERPVAYEDTTAYFKIHMTEKDTWVICRLQFRKEGLLVWVPMPQDQVSALAAGRPVTPQGNWSVVTLADPTQLGGLAPLLRESYAFVRDQRTSGDQAES